LTLKGHLVRPEAATNGERGLVAACILQAVKDAERQGPDGEAARWLREVGARWGELLGLHPTVLESWQPGTYRTRHKGRVEVLGPEGRRQNSIERQRRWRERKRQARCNV